MYIETSSPRKPGDKAVLTSPPLVFSKGENTMAFSCHMYGSSIGQLSVEVDGREVWKKTGNQGNSWMQIVLPLPTSAQTIKFIGVIGSGWAGDIAIDSIRFFRKNGPPGPPARPPAGPPGGRPIVGPPGLPGKTGPRGWPG